MWYEDPILFSVVMVLIFVGIFFFKEAYEVMKK
jgi:hypothetical protein